MATEIERKFLLKSDNWRQQIIDSSEYIQGYLSNNKTCSIRVRITGEKAAINIKSATLGITRTEYDYPIPINDAKELLDKLCIKPLIEKTRYHVDYGEHRWEIDVFSGDNEGLVVAELELGSINEGFAKPDWLGEEVSDDPRYYNVCLVNHPYKNW